MLEFIKQLAVEAGKRVLAGGARLTAADIRAKENPADMVTVVDREVEAFIRGEIEKAYPDHGIYGEETGRAREGAEFRWLIDPIDGTTGFIHGFPYYSVSIALLHRGRREAGVVFAPALCELFAAEQGGGATLNGRPIHVSDCTEMRNALLATGFGCVRARRKPDNFDYLPAITRSVQDIRRCGSAALDLCNVAAGRFDGYWEFALQPYDIAAGTLILEEAGGVVSDIAGGGNWPERGFVATNGELHRALLACFE